ncbi:MAG: glycosyltransferase family 4 protein [Candidatus Edwardsbacteria bacterium]|nr:glycosyltransferase family 4 protein [Candidatus Edwardsbacteria bacterium]
MRILYLTTDAFGGHGGISKYNIDLLTALCSYPNCHEVVAIPRRATDEYGALPKNLKYHAVGGTKLGYIKSMVGLVFKDRKFDLVVCAHLNLLPLAYLCNLLIRAPLLQILYGIDAWTATDRWAVNLLASKADRYISISQITKGKFVSWSKADKNKIDILPNAIDIGKYGPGFKPEYLSDRYGLQGKTVIMTLGRMAAEEKAKGFDQILEIMPELGKRFSNLVYLVVGDGSDRARLEEKAKKLGLKGQVVFTGLIPEREKADHYRLADAYVMPSRLEGFGFVFLEAMACGIPVVASKIDGGREALLNGKLGGLADPNDPQDMLQKIFEALKRPKGHVPGELEYFSFNNFEQRCHKIVKSMV